MQLATVSLVEGVVDVHLVLTPWPAERYRSVFKDFPFFNLVQSKVFDDVSPTTDLSLWSAACCALSPSPLLSSSLSLPLSLSPSPPPLLSLPHMIGALH